MLFETPLIRQFLNSFVSKFQTPFTAEEDLKTTYEAPNDSTFFYEESIISNSSEEEQSSFYRYAPSSIYSNESFTSDDLDWEYQVYEEELKVKNSSLFEKTYVSFPQIDSYSTPTSNLAKREYFTMPEIVTATATPTFYTKPHHNTYNNKSIWNSSVELSDMMTNLYQLAC